MSIAVVAGCPSRRNIYLPFPITLILVALISSLRIINVGSVVGLMPQDAPTHAYDVSKAGVHHLTKKLSGDLAPYNITVNALAPGFVPSRMTEGLKSYTTFDDIAKNTPLQRLGDGDDMTGACIYLSSRAGSYVTGVILNVDGGTIGASKIPLSFEED